MADKKDYPQWFIDLMHEMLEMRDAQQAYFKQPNQYNLKVSKAKEGKADQRIEHFIKMGIIKRKDKPAINSNELFK